MVPKTRPAGPVRPKIAPNLSNRNSFPEAKASRAAHIRAHIHVRACATSPSRQVLPLRKAALLRLMARPPAAEPPAETVLVAEMLLPAQALLSQLPPPLGLLIRKSLTRRLLLRRVLQRLPIQMSLPPMPPGEVLPTQVLSAQVLPVQGALIGDPSTRFRQGSSACRSRTAFSAGCPASPTRPSAACWP